MKCTNKFSYAIDLQGIFGEMRWDDGIGNEDMMGFLRWPLFMLLIDSQPCAIRHTHSQFINRFSGCGVPHATCAYLFYH